MTSKRRSKAARSSEKVRAKGLATKSLKASQANTVKGGGKRAGGTSGGNVAGGWDLLANKVHS
jgi:hypothetical protein